jgi:hypothetical protein
MNTSKISPPSALASTIGGVMYMHSFAKGGTLLSLVNNEIIFLENEIHF